MLWLGNVFKLREKIFHKRKSVAFDEEKPFLDHLEDLRHTLVRVVSTLAVAMIVCFIFDQYLFEIVKRPVKIAGVVDPDEARLPAGFTGEEWKEVGQITQGIRELPPALRETWLETACAGSKAKLRPAIHALEIARAAQSLPEADRAAWLEKSSAVISESLPIAQALLEKKLDLRLNWQSAIQMQSFAPVEVFNQSMKMAFVGGIIISFPFLLYFLLQFVLPGLKPEEKKVLWPSLFVGFGLFLVGVTFCYFWVAPNALKFFHQYAMDRGMSSDYRFADYVSFITQFTLIFGLAFELPVVVYALIKLGLLSYPGMSRTRSYAIIVITIVAAIITPTPDAFSMAIMAGPMILLYEICIWIAYFDHKKQLKIEAEEEKERAAWRERNALAALEAGEHKPDEHGTSADPHHDPYHDHHHGDYHDPHRDDPGGHPYHDHPPFEPENESTASGTVDAYHAAEKEADKVDETPPPQAPGSVHSYDVVDPYKATESESPATEEPTTSVNEANLETSKAADKPQSSSEDHTLPQIRPAGGTQRHQD